MNMGIILKEMKQGYTDLLLHKTNKEIICAMPIDFLSSVTRGIKAVSYTHLTLPTIA